MIFKAARNNQKHSSDNTLFLFFRESEMKENRTENKKMTEICSEESGFSILVIMICVFEIVMSCHT